jgi:rod shape-determining protein MreD
MTLARRVLGIPVTLLIAVLAQVVVVNRVPLPGDAGPDLVLLAVTALGAMLGPMTGMIAGFCGGLALDIAPPSGHLAGEYALVFCLAGYLCGRLRDFVDPMEEHSVVTTVSVMAVGAVGGEAGKAALALMLSDPDATGQAVAHVLPGAILYDLVLTPLALWLTALAVARPASPSAPDTHRARPSPQYGTVRAASSGGAPKLHLGGAPTAAPPAPVRREPRLRLAGSTSPALFRTDRSGSPASAALGGRKTAPVSFSGSSRSAVIGGGSPRAGSARGGRPAGAGGNGLLGGGLFGAGLFGGASVFSGSGSLGPSLYSGGLLRGPGRPNSGRRPGKGWLKAGKPGTGTGSGRALAGRGPGKGWLRAAAGPAKTTARPGSPGRGWLKAAPKSAQTLRRKSPGKGWLNRGGGLGGYGLGGSGFGRPRLGGQGPRRGSFGGGGFSSRGIGGTGIKGGRRNGLGGASAYRRRRRPRLGGRR